MDTPGWLGMHLRMRWERKGREESAVRPRSIFLVPARHENGIQEYRISLVTGGPEAGHGHGICYYWTHILFVFFYFLAGGIAHRADCLDIDRTQRADRPSQASKLQPLRTGVYYYSIKTTTITIIPF